jgi:hypothetical protein
VAYKKERVVLMPFFAYGHVKNVDADRVGTLLSDWGVKIT